MKMLKSSKEILERIEIAFWTVSIRIMGNRKLILALICSACALVLFMLIGAIYKSKPSSFQEGQNPIQDFEYASISSQPGHTPTVIPNQSNLLIVLVDDLSSSQPELIGLWLAGRVSSAPQIIFLPIFPSQSSSKSENAIHSSFLDTSGNLDENFVNTLHTREIWWDHYLAADMNSLIDLVSLMNGISWNGENYTGPEIVTLISEILDQPRVALELQAQIAGELCNNLPDWAVKADSEILEGLFESRFRSDMEFGLIQSARQKISGPEGIPVCAFPTINGLSQTWSMD